MKTSLRAILQRKFRIMHTALLVLTMFLTIEMPAFSQNNDLTAEVELQAIGTSNHAVPFWFRANQGGSIPNSGYSSSFIGKFGKNYTKEKKKMDWMFAFEGRSNASKNPKLLLIEAFAAVKKGAFQIKAGRAKDQTGLLGDSSLSSGSFAISGNALGIPKLEISIPDYTPLPFLGNFISIKGNFAHGWIGTISVSDTIGAYHGTTIPIPSKSSKAKTFLHQKSLYLKLGYPSWRLKLMGGFSHQVFWGDERKVYGPNFSLSSLETFFYVATGKTYGNSNDIPNSKIGNQLGSIDGGVSYDFDALNVTMFRQNFYDVGALSRLANIRDGLTGLAITNTKEIKRDIFLKRLVVEFFYSKNQAGEVWSKATNSGDEDYYNNYYYPQGWSYRGLNLGNPLITRKDDAKEGQASDPHNEFINNRVKALHFGLEASIKTYDVRYKFTYSRNYGTFSTSTTGRSTGSERFPPIYGIFTPVSQLSNYLEISRTFKGGITAGTAIALDNGRLLSNSHGAILKLSKSFL